MARASPPRRRQGRAGPLAAARAAPSAAAALDEWARHVARFHPKALAVTRAVEQVHRHDPDAAEHRKRYLSEQLAACRSVMRRLEEEGVLAAPWTVEVASEMLWALLATDMLERLLVERRWSRRALGDRPGVRLPPPFLAHA